MKIELQGTVVTVNAQEGKPPKACLRIVQSHFNSFLYIEAYLKVGETYKITISDGKEP